MSGILPVNGHEIANQFLLAFRAAAGHLAAMKRQLQLSTYDPRRLALVSLCDERTILRWLADPSSVREASGLRILAAMAQLGITISRNRREVAA